MPTTVGGLRKLLLELLIAEDMSKAAHHHNDLLNPYHLAHHHYMSPDLTYTPIDWIPNAAKWPGKPGKFNAKANI